MFVIPSGAKRSRGIDAERFSLPRVMQSSPLLGAPRARRVRRTCLSPRPLLGESVGEGPTDGFFFDRSLTPTLSQLEGEGLTNQQSLCAGTFNSVCASDVPGNSAAHGPTVQASVAQWAIEYAPKVLAVLDDHLESAEG